MGWVGLGLGLGIGLGLGLGLGKAGVLDVPSPLILHAVTGELGRLG